MEPYEAAKRRTKRSGKESLIEIPSDDPSPSVDGTVLDPVPKFIAMLSLMTEATWFLF